MAVECPRCNTVSYSRRTTCGTCGNGLSSTRSNPSPYPLRQDDMMSLKHQKMAVFDIDATLFDITQRTRNAIRAGVLAKDGSRPKGDRAFYKFLDKHSNPDEPISGTVDFVNSLARKNYVIAYLTARPRRVRKKTIETLEKAGYPVFNDHDNTPMVYLKIDGDESPKFKQDKLKKLQRRFNVLYFYDDLEANREMARALDIPGVYDLRERLGIVVSNPPTGGSKVTVWVVIHQGGALEDKEFRGVYGSEEEAQHSFSRDALAQQYGVRFEHNHHILRKEITIPPASNPPTGGSKGPDGELLPDGFRWIQGLGTVRDPPQGRGWHKVLVPVGAGQGLGDAKQAVADRTGLPLSKIYEELPANMDFWDGPWESATRLRISGSELPSWEYKFYYKTNPRQNPMLKPRKKKNRREPARIYMKRLLSSPKMNAQFPDPAQRYAVSLSLVKKHYGLTAVNRVTAKTNPSYATCRVCDNRQVITGIVSPGTRTMPLNQLDGVYQCNVCGSKKWASAELVRDDARLREIAAEEEKKNPSLESKGRELYAKFNGKKPASVKKESINIPPVWVKIGEGGVWSIGYNSGKETGDSNQKYIHNFNEDSKDGNFPDLYAAINEDGQAELLVLRGGTFKLETRDDGLTWLVD